MVPSLSVTYLTFQLSVVLTILFLLCEVVIANVEPRGQLANAAFDNTLRSASLPVVPLMLIADDAICFIYPVYYDAGYSGFAFPYPAVISAAVAFLTANIQFGELVYCQPWLLSKIGPLYVVVVLAPSNISLTDPTV